MNRRPRFCVMTIFYPPYGFGGDAVYVHRLVNALARRGYEVDVIHSIDAYRALGSEPQITELTSHPRVTVHGLRSEWGFLSQLLAQQTGRPVFHRETIRAILLSKKFDVIHYHNISLFGPRVLGLSPDYTDFIKLYTMHEHWLVCPMHVLWKNNRRLCDRPTCFTCSLAFQRPPQWWRYTSLLDRELNNVDQFVAPSRFTREIHQQRGFSQPITCLPPFLPDPPEEPPDSRPVHPRPYFLFVGRLEKIKGAQELIPIFRSYPHADLLIAGTGAYEAELRQAAAGMPNVVFLGRVSQTLLPAYYRQAVALIVPSLCYETFGMTIVEAFAEKTPVIAHALGPLPEVIEQSGGGIAYHNQLEMLDAMERLRSTPQLARQLGEQGYQAYRRHWSEESHLAAYFQMLEQTALRKLGRVPWAVIGTPDRIASGRIAAR